MKVGGKFFQAGAFQQKKFSYGKQMNRAAVQNLQFSMQSSANALFEAQITFGQEMAMHSIKQLAARLQDDAKAMFSKYDGLTGNLQAANPAASTGTVLDETA